MRGFTKDFRLALAVDQSRWYARIADRLNVSNLVTSDKGNLNYWERDPLRRFDTIILYKAPVQQVRSALKWLQISSGPTLKPNCVTRYRLFWKTGPRTYLAHLKRLKTAGTLRVV
jgi:hypothetical protein